MGCRAEIARDDFTLDVKRGREFLPGRARSSADELVHGTGNDEIGALFLERLDRRRRLLGSSAGDHGRQSLLVESRGFARSRRAQTPSG